MSETEPVRLALLGRRVVARFLDASMLGLVAAANVLCQLGVLWLVNPNHGQESRRQSHEEFGVGATGLFWGLVFLAWVYALPLVLFAVSHVYEVTVARRTGQAWGKRLLGVCVVRSGSSWPEVPCYGRLMLRWLVLHAPAVVLLGAGIVIGWPFDDWRLMLYGAGYLAVVTAPAAVSRSRRGLHDLLAGTTVADVGILPDGHAARGVWWPAMDAQWQRFQRDWRERSSSSRALRNREGSE